MYKDFQDLISNKIKILENKIKTLDLQIDDINSHNSFFDIFNKRKNDMLLYLGNYIKRLENIIEKLKTIDFEESKEIEQLISLGVDLDSSDYEYFKRSKTKNLKRKIEKIDDLILVHKTNTLPKEGTLYSPRDGHAKSHDKFVLNDKEYNYEYLVGNNTLHFCLNGPVTNHSYGSWADRRYGILIPAYNVERHNLIRFEPEDTYFQNKLKLPKGSMIICPSSERENASKQNPDVDIITYDESITLSEAIECAIYYKGYKVKEITNNNWFEIMGEDDVNNLSKIKEENNIIDYEERHYYSDNLKYARLESLCNRTASIIKCLIENNLEDIDTENLSNILNGIHLFGEPKFYKNDYTLYLTILIDQIRKENIGIDENTLAKINNSIKDYILFLKTSWGDPVDYRIDDMWCEHLTYINLKISSQLLEYSKNKKYGIVDTVENDEESHMHL